MKKVILSLAFLFILMPCAYAASPEAVQAAEALHDLGLFQGTGIKPDGTPDYNLDAVPTRNQAVILLVRLLGKEAEAKTGKWKLPFADVAPSSLSFSYIGYAYKNGYTKGTSDSTYSGTASVTRNQYLLFLMRVLGYDTGDMKPADAADRAAVLRLTEGTDAGYFTRGDAALLSYRALDCFLYALKPNAATLREALGLGSSPLIQNRPADTRSTRYADYETACRQVADKDIAREISVPGGKLVSFHLGDTPHGAVWCLWHLCEDGTRVSLPLPLLNTRGASAQPLSLTYNAVTGMLTYQAVIEAGQSAVPNEPVRRPGTYAYAYDLSGHTATVTELSRTGG